MAEQPPSHIQACILAHCGPATDWHVEPGSERRPEWLVLRHERARLRTQGWKLHITASIASAEAVLARALPLLLAEEISFKVAASLQILAELNRGEAGLSQIGKFITIYPGDDAQAIRLARALDEAIRGLRGPAIPSDRPLTPGSLVYYRYGGFAQQYLQTRAGALVLAITAPDGTLVPDRREAFFCPPEWAVDPFVSAGVAPALTEPPTLLNERYVIMATLHVSPRGTVARAVDIRAPRRCVLKRAGGAAQMQADGRDACDNLRHEAAVLRCLAPDPRFPTVFDLFSFDDDLILVLEDFTGQTLTQYIETATGQGRLLPNAHLLTWARELADTLAHIHAKGFIYRDLKSTNLIVTPEGRLRLIDFGITHTPHSSVRPYGLGTRGYTSPQSAALAAPSIADDIYGFGALLYYLATGAEPAQAPRPFHLLDRRPSDLNPTLRPEIEQMIARCLDPDPAARYPSMTALADALSAIGQTDAAMTPPSGPGPPPRPGPEARRHYAELARRVGDMLCNAAQVTPGGTGLAWPNDTTPGRGSIVGDLYSGVSGIVLSIAEVVGALGHPAHGRVLAKSAHWLATPLGTAEPHAPGLFVGKAGVGAALLRAGQVLDDQHLIAAATKRSAEIAAMPFGERDMMSGTAGRLRFHLLLWDETADPQQLRAAIRAGEELLSTSEEQGDGERCWPIPADDDDLDGRRFIGYAHGSAGIADALLDLFEATRDERFLQEAQDAGRWITQLSIPALADGSGLTWPQYPGASASPSYWCHGAAGVGQFFLHAAKLGVIAGAANLAARAARTAAHGARWTGPAQCHGLAGNIEFLLDMFQATHAPQYLEQAHALARLLEAFLGEMKHPGGQSSNETAAPPLSYMTGYAGIMVCLLRLSEPETSPGGLRRRRFR